MLKSFSSFTENLRSPQSKSMRRLKWLAGAATVLLLMTVSVDTKSFYEFVPQWDAPLVAAVQSEINRFNGRVGFYLKDLQTGRTLAINADELFPSASLVKVPIMMGVFKKIAAGEISLDTTLVLRRDDKVGGSGILKRCRSGSRWTVERLLRLMISRSDNTAARMLVNLTGIPYLNSTFQSLDLQVTRVQEEPLFRLTPDVSVENYTTPREMARLLENLYHGGCITPESSQRMMDIMKKGKARHRLARYLPRGWEIADKTGLLRGACHHIGIVFTPHGNFLICVLTADNTDSEYGRAKQFIARVGRKVFRHRRDEYRHS